MAEITQPFWLASATLDASASVADWLRSVRVQPRWLEEIVVFSSAQIRFDKIEGCRPSTLVYRWPDWQISQHLLLHQACREISLGERRLILLLAEAPTSTTVLLLGAPAAVGLYNLDPLASAAPFLSEHLENADVNLLEEIEPRLKKLDKKPSELNTMLISPGPCKKPVKSQTPFAPATWTKSLSNNEQAFESCQNVLAALTQTGKKNGLALEVDMDLNLYATWIERL